MERMRLKASVEAKGTDVIGSRNFAGLPVFLHSVVTLFPPLMRVTFCSRTHSVQSLTTRFTSGSMVRLFIPSITCALHVEQTDQGPVSRDKILVENRKRKIPGWGGKW